MYSYSDQNLKEIPKLKISWQAYGSEKREVESRKISSNAWAVAAKYSSLSLCFWNFQAVLWQALQSVLYAHIQFDKWESYKTGED